MGRLFFYEAKDNPRLNHAEHYPVFFRKQKGKGWKRKTHLSEGMRVETTVRGDIAVEVLKNLERVKDFYFAVGSPKRGLGETPKPPISGEIEVLLGGG